MFHINMLGEDMISSSPVVKELDLFLDTDVIRSDQFVIHPQKKYLEFQYKHVQDVLNGNCRCIYGKALWDSKDGIILKPEADQPIDQSKKLCLMLIEQPILPGEVDVIGINFEKDHDLSVHVAILNQFSYNHKELSILRTAHLLQNVRLVHGFDESALTIYKLTGSNRMDLCKMPLNGKTSHVDYLINIKKGYVSKDKNKFLRQKLRHEDITQYEKCYLVIEGFHWDKFSNIERRLHVKAISYGYEMGYIYFKPIYLESQCVQIVVLYTGEIEVQYYNNKTSAWSSIGTDGRVFCEKKLELRMKMISQSRIYRFLILGKG